MKVFRMFEGEDKPREADTLSRALELERFYPKAVLSAVGAGGKTSSLYELAREQSAAGRKVIITTTTHMKHPEEYGYLLGEGSPEEELANMRDILDRSPYLMTGREVTERKVEGLPDDLRNRLTEFCELLLIEADGARRLPIKVPRHYEPVVPENTGIIAAVMGLDSLDRMVQESTCRLEEMEKLLRVSADTIITEEIVAKALFYGYREPLSRQFPKTAFFYILNKADTEELRTRAFIIDRLLLEYEEAAGLKPRDGFVITTYNPEGE